MHHRAALPVGNRIHLVPCVEQLRLLARVSGTMVTHIEVGARNGTTCTRWWFGSFFLKSTFIACSQYWPSPPFHWLYIKLPRSPFTSPTDGCRLYHLAVAHRIFSAVFTSTVLPALALVIKLPGGNDVFHSTRLARVSLAPDSRTICRSTTPFLPCQLILHPQ